MRNASKPPITAAPWTERLIDAIPVSSVQLALATACVLLALFLAIEVAAGRHTAFLAGELDERLRRDIRFAVITALALAYIIGANRGLRSATRRNLEALRTQLRPRREAEGLIEADLPLDPNGARLGGIIGIAVALTMPFLVDWEELPFFTRGYWIPETAWIWLLLILAGWVSGRVGHASLEAAGLFSRLARSQLSVDLLDTRPLSPFVRQGMETALAWLGFIAVVALTLLNQRMGIVMAINGLGAFVLSVTALLLPLRGVHEQLVNAKARELDWVREAIRQERHRLREGGETRGEAAGSMPGLLAYEARVEGVREWPFDVPTLLRFTLYLAIPLASWFGGAMVERLLGVILD
jgi:hypothetical protein